jgi:hypothetical protein
MAISTETREEVRRRYHYRCGYCGVHENDVGSELEIDHFKPKVFGGTDDLENLVYCCPACNKFKHDFWPSIQASTNPRRLLHPMTDNIQEHLAQDEGGRLIALSETGAFHLEKLRLNRPQLLAFREKRLIEKKVYTGIAEAAAKSKELGTRGSELTELLNEAFTQIERLRGE